MNDAAVRAWVYLNDVGQWAALGFFGLFGLSVVLPLVGRVREIERRIGIHNERAAFGDEPRAEDA